MTAAAAGALFSVAEHSVARNAVQWDILYTWSPPRTRMVGTAPTV